MTAQEIRAVEVQESDNVSKLLREIAAQLADANEARRAREAKIDQDIAEAKARADKKSEFFDALVADLQPVLPKIKEFIERTFDPAPFAGPLSDVPLPPVSSPVAVVRPIPAQLPADFNELVQFVIGRGYSEEAARTIVTNHAAATRADFEQAKAQKEASDAEEKKTAAPAQEERAVPQT